LLREFRDQRVQCDTFLLDAQDTADAPYGVLEHDARDGASLVLPSVPEKLNAMIKEVIEGDRYRVVLDGCEEPAFYLFK
jgi:hypothetical protein